MGVIRLVFTSLVTVAAAQATFAKPPVAVTTLDFKRLGQSQVTLTRRVSGAFADAQIFVSELPDKLDDPALDAIYQALLQTVLAIWPDATLASIQICGGHGRCFNLEDFLATPRHVLDAAIRAYEVSAKRVSSLQSGALAGKRIVISPGHGYVFSNGEWGFQRGVTCRLREDIHTNQIVIDELLPALVRAGATVISARERSYVTDEAILGPPFLASGQWGTGNTGFLGAGFFCTAWPCEAFWTFVPKMAGAYSLDAFVVPYSGATDAALYKVTHPGGTSEMLVNQALFSATSVAGRWEPLGLFELRPDEQVTVSVTSDSGVLVADVVRFGGGMGSADFGGGPSGVPRWQESAFAHLSALKAPDWVVGTNSNDVIARPLYALFQGADLFLSVHTNAFNGTASGTSTYVWHHDYCPGCGLEPIPSELPPGTLEFATLLHSHVLNAVRTMWDPAWPDKKLQGCNFGELRPLAQAWSSNPEVVVPGALVEIAFHDNCSQDAVFLRERRFRRDVSRGILKAVIDFFRGPFAQEVIYPPLPPHALAAQVQGTNVLLRWEAQLDPVHPDFSRPERYFIYHSDDGRVFSVEPYSSTLNTISLPLEPCRAKFFKVTGVNSAGESIDSITVVARGAIEGGLNLLLVDGMDRWVQTVDDPNYSSSFLDRILHALLSSDFLSSRLVIHSASDEAVGEYLDLKQFDAVIWIVGETSTRDEAITAKEREMLKSYLDAGGRLLLSGAEIAWYLGVTSKDQSDKEFLETYLHTLYTSDDDDAGTSYVDAVQEGILKGLPFHSFGTGKNGTYLVEYPDVLPPGPGAVAVAHYAGGNGPAIIAYPGDPSVGGMRIIYAGYPIETIEDPEALRFLLEKSLMFLLADIEQKGFVVCEARDEPGADVAQYAETDGFGFADDDLVWSDAGTSCESCAEVCACEPTCPERTVCTTDNACLPAHCPEPGGTGYFRSSGGCSANPGSMCFHSTLWIIFLFWLLRRVRWG